MTGITARVQTVEVTGDDPRWPESNQRAVVSWSDDKHAYGVHAPLTSRVDNEARYPGSVNRTDQYPRALADAVWGDFYVLGITDWQEAAREAERRLARWIEAMANYDAFIAGLSTDKQEAGQ
jgi:hypothetical protein